MKILTKLSLFFYFVLVFVGCKQNDEEKNKLELDPMKSTFHQKGIIEEIQEKLVSNNDVLKIFDIEEIKIESDLGSNESTIIDNLLTFCDVDSKGNFYFVGVSGEIYKVSPKGKLIKKFSSIGNGPGEYLSIDNIRIDGEQNIYIYDLRRNQIIKYNNSFEYLFSIS